MVAACISRRRRGYCYKRCVLRRREEGGRYFQGVLCSNVHKGHHCWVLRAFTSAFAHRRACRRSHEYSGDPFDPRRLLTVALYDNCSSQIALSSAVREAAFGTKLTARPGTRRPVDASDQSSGQHPAPKRKLASTRRRPTRISNRAHAPEKFDSHLEPPTRLSVPAAPVRGTNHDV